MKRIEYSTLAEGLLDALPELRPRYEAERCWKIEEQGPHTVLGVVLNPYLVELLGKGGDEESLRRVFTFLEQLATHPDPDVRGVVRATVCERLGDDATRLERSRRFMGPATSRLSEEIEAFWHKGQPR